MDKFTYKVIKYSVFKDYKFVDTNKIDIYIYDRAECIVTLLNFADRIAKSGYRFYYDEDDYLLEKISFKLSDDETIDLPTISVEYLSFLNDELGGLENNVIRRYKYSYDDKLRLGEELIYSKEFEKNNEEVLFEKKEYIYKNDKLAEISTYCSNCWEEYGSYYIPGGEEYHFGFKKSKEIYNYSENALKSIIHLSYDYESLVEELKEFLNNPIGADNYIKHQKSLFNEEDEKKYLSTSYEEYINFKKSGIINRAYDSRASKTVEDVSDYIRNIKFEDNRIVEYEKRLNKEQYLNIKFYYDFMGMLKQEIREINNDLFTAEMIDYEYI